MELILKLTLATIIGAIIGYDRRAKRGTAGAGMKTFAIIAMTGCVVAILSSKVESENITRYATGLTQAFSFLGVALLVKGGDRVRGLTTAVMSILTIVLGVCVGFGAYSIPVVVLVLIMILFKVERMVK